MPKMSERLARSGVLTALLTVLLMMARFRMFRLSALVASSLVLVISMILLGFRQTIYIFLATSILAIIFLPSSATVMFLLFFGAYPLFKAYLENQNQRWLVLWPTKLIYFFAVFFIVRYVLWIFLHGNWAFVSRVSIFAIPMAVLFDLALSLAAPYLERWLKSYRLY